MLMTPDAFRTFVEAEIARCQKVITISGAKLELGDLGSDHGNSLK